jgi:hypothetical protein
MAREKKAPDLGVYDVPLLKREGMISKEELALLLDIPEATLDHWASRGRGPNYHLIGNHRKYWPADVVSWLTGQRREVGKDVA